MQGRQRQNWAIQKALLGNVTFCSGRPNERRERRCLVQYTLTQARGLYTSAWPPGMKGTHYSVQQNCLIQSNSHHHEVFSSAEPSQLSGILSFLLCKRQHGHSQGTWKSNPNWIKLDRARRRSPHSHCHVIILTSQSKALTRPCAVGCSSPLFFHASPPSSVFLSSWWALASAAHGVLVNPWLPMVDTLDSRQ